MARVVGRYESSLTPTVHKRPTLVCLEVMVKLAQAVQEIEDRYVSAGPVLAVVRLEESGPRATAVHQYKKVG